jgi:hypothetical protein
MLGCLSTGPYGRRLLGRRWRPPVAAVGLCGVLSVAEGAFIACSAAAMLCRSCHMSSGEASSRACNSNRRRLPVLCRRLLIMLVMLLR